MKYSVMLMIFTIFFFSACQKDDPVSSNTEDKAASVNMYFQKPPEIAYLVSSAEVIVSAGGMDSIMVPLTVTEEEVYGTIEKIPAGMNRKFEVFTYDAQGINSYYGHTTSDIPAGETIYLNIVLYPVEQTGTVIISGTFSDYPEILNKIVFEDDVN